MTEKTTGASIGKAQPTKSAAIAVAEYILDHLGHDKANEVRAKAAT